MRTAIFVSLLALVTLYSCGQDTELQNRLIATQTELLQAKTELEQATAAPAITHLVYLNTKDDVDMDVLKKELIRLGEIPGVKAYQLGSFLDLGDPRAMAENELILSMGFNTTEDYQAYQQHPTHRDVKEKLKPYLEGSPVTYDFE